MSTSYHTERSIVEVNGLAGRVLQGNHAVFHYGLNIDSGGILNRYIVNRIEHSSAGTADPPAGLTLSYDTYFENNYLVAKLSGTTNVAAGAYYFNLKFYYTAYDATNPALSEEHEVWTTLWIHVFDAATNAPGSLVVEDISNPPPTWYKQVHGHEDFRVGKSHTWTVRYSY
jgi:hypothetical protein